MTRKPELAGQTVVVIGGSAGIGLETARRASSCRTHERRRREWKEPRPLAPGGAWQQRPVLADRQWSSGWLCHGDLGFVSNRRRPTSRRAVRAHTDDGRSS